MGKQRVGKSRKRTQLRLDARPGSETVAGVLNDRQTTHGDYRENARISQHLKDFIRSADGWHQLTNDMRESLDMTCLKVSRILSGRPTTKDHWVDIAGYATLVSDELEQ